MFKKLKKGVKRFAGLSLAGEEEINSLVKDIQRSLLKADVDVELVSEISDRIKDNALKEDIPKGITRKEHVLHIVYQELERIMGEGKEVKTEPKRILLAGLYGSGKTTSSGKIAEFYRKRGLKTGLLACDPDREAAYDQLKQVAEKADSKFSGIKGEENTSKIVRNGLKELEDCDVIILDSAGRNSLNKELSKELEEISSEFEPDEKILVVPADIGQAAKEQAESFDNAVGINSVLVTKMDSSAKGGGALTSCAQAGAKIQFIGTGESLEDLEVYDPVDFVSQMLGVPDLDSLLEKAEEAMEPEEAEKFLEGEFTIEEFIDQVSSIGDFGAIDQIMDKLPFKKKLPDNVMEMQQEKIEKYKEIIKSMTPEEKRDPKIINSSRAERIAKGSGTDSKDVKELIKQYRQAKNMMNKFSGKKMKGRNMKKIMNQLGMR